jgi:hypothetical protein
MTAILKAFALVLITEIVLCSLAVAQGRGGAVQLVQTNADGSKHEVQLYDGSYALVIGNSEYNLGWEN